MPERYREEYLKKLNGNGRLYEADILKIMLGNAFGGKDMSNVADALLARFPSVKSVLEADEKEILAVEGANRQIVAYLKAVNLIYKFSDKKELYVKNAEQCFETAASRFLNRDNEFMEIYFVTKTGKVADIKTFTSLRVNRVEVAASDVYAAILSSDAHGIYLVHNHVNSPAAPSSDDDLVTARIYEACAMCRVVFHDHCILSTTGDRFSYVQSGRLEDIKAGLKRRKF